MKWIVITIVLWIIWKWLRRKPKQLAREEYKEPPQFESIVIGDWRPPSDQAAARAQRQFDSSGIDEQL